jgi:hypothetical protein
MSLHTNATLGNCGQVGKRSMDWQLDMGLSPLNRIPRRSPCRLRPMTPLIATARDAPSPLASARQQVGLLKFRHNHTSNQRVTDRSPGLPALSPTASPTLPPKPPELSPVLVRLRSKLQKHGWLPTLAAKSTPRLRPSTPEESSPGLLATFSRPALSPFPRHVFRRRLPQN